MEGPFSLGAWGKMFTEGRALNSSGEVAGGVEIAESGASLNGAEQLSFFCPVSETSCVAWLGSV